MKLYHSPGACSRSVQILLEESGLPFSLVKVDLKNHTALGKDYYQLNPKGSVPMIELDNGNRLTEAAVLLQFVADQSPAKKLMANAGSIERYHQMEWLNFCATELHKGFSPLFDPNLSDDAKALLKAKLYKKFDLVEKRLGAHPYLTGESFAAPDAYLFTVMGWAQRMKFEMDKWPAMMAFYKRMSDRPSVQRATEADAQLQ